METAMSGEPVRLIWLESTALMLAGTLSTSMLPLAPGDVGR
jgi:hypothetical protein